MRWPAWHAGSASSFVRWISIHVQSFRSIACPRSVTESHTDHTCQVVLERNTRNKKKCVTTIAGLDLFGVKLAEASKLFGKKFASGASIVKNAEGKEQIDIQVKRECT